jgi:sulfite exporter TauE/SafE
MGTWETPLQEYWANNFIVTADFIAGGRTLPTGVFTQTIDPTLVFRPTLSITGAFSPTLTATKTGFLQTTPSSQFTATITAIKTAVGTAIPTAQATVTPTAVKTTRITQTLSAQASITDAVTKFVKTGATPSAQFTTNGVLPPTRVRTSAIPALSSTFSISAAVPLIVAFGISTKSSSFSMSVSADRIRLGINEVYISIATVADVNPTIIWGPTITFQTVASILGLGLGYAIDPWRTLPIRSETRINILEQETRTYMIPSETRTLKVLPGANTRVVNEPGIIDRREG